MHLRAAWLLAVSATSWVPTTQDLADLGLTHRPGAPPVDRSHPDRDAAPTPRRGGRVTLHLAAQPASLNYMLDSSASARHLLNELHEPLIRRDWESWEWRGVLAESWDVQDDGRSWTFVLRDGIRWHDGHEFDAADVRFSWSLWKNPGVRCDRRRYMFDKITRCEVLDERTVRFTFGAPYYMAASAFDESLTILPAHRYDLTDPEHPEHDPDATAEQQAVHVNEHPLNRDWLGLGPFRLVSNEAQTLVARRFEGYFDPARGGWVDEIRWRVIRDSAAALQAVLEGELDFYDRLSSADYFGGAASTDAFTARCYAGHYFTPYMGYTAWNVKRPRLSDPRVRRALGMCFDWDAFVNGYYRGLAFRVTGEQWIANPAYDRSLEPLEYDLDAARRLLQEAGWYDRDGDGRVDRDGEPLHVELLMPAGNPTSAAFGQLWQERLEELGVELSIAARDFASLRELVLTRDFDALALGLTLAFESDPEQLWHSRWSTGASGNRSGLDDEMVDRLIEAIQVELDTSARVELHHRLQARLYELQPFQFGVCAPRRFAMAKRVRGFQSFALDPGYAVRRWFVVEDD
jgi:peptide/nickel transport system substrate-binding protein